ncbi:MAG: TAXI family TRAP transporter solute-binding subunit [Alteromonadaceae bacterium]|nr:TAXI family TRAP transporter solute-binding subunit [Alteromonadaceae bacterium]
MNLSNQIKVTKWLTLAASLAFSHVVSADSYDFPRLLAIGTPSTMTGSFAATNGWAPILQEDKGINVRVIPEDSELQRYRRLNFRQDLAMSAVAVSELESQTQGLDGYAGYPASKQRVVWQNVDTPWGIVTRGDSPLNTMEDLKKGGVKISVPSFSPSLGLNVTHALPAFLGVSPENAEELFEFVPTSSYADTCKAVVERKVDIAICSPISGVLSEMEGAPSGIKWISMDSSNVEGWKRYLDYRTVIIPTTIDIGVSSARGVDGFISNFVYAMPAEATVESAYNMAKWMHQSFESYKSTHPLNSRMSLDVFRNYLDKSAMPVHEGTVKYLKEVGAWTEEDDAWNQAAIEKMDRWYGARQAALAEAKDKRIRPSHDNPEYMEILSQHTESLEVFKSRL